jgi:hypothetical protein
MVANRLLFRRGIMAELRAHTDLARTGCSPQAVGLAMVFFAMLAGCQAPIELASNEAPITNGTPATGDPSVVALVRTGTRAAFCTGTLIAPRVVLTAAHCVQPGSTDTQAFFGSDLAATGTFIDVVYVAQATGFDRGTLTNDVALLLLAGSSPEQPKPVSQRPFDPSFVGRTIRIVGFGAAGGANDTSMLKREGVATIAELDDTTFLFHPSPSQTCVGDSGGPAFSPIEGVEYLIGIARSGDPDCVLFARHTRIDPFVASFITPFLEHSAEGTSEPGDGSCSAEAGSSSIGSALAMVIAARRRRRHADLRRHAR